MSLEPAGMPPLALLAGGRGNRISAIAPHTPKALISVAGEPFISHQLKLLKREGITDVVICAGYLGEQIQDFVQDGTLYGLHVRYSFDGEKLLGTGGAVRHALHLLGSLFWVMYGDSYLNVSFLPILEYFHAHSKTALMTVFRNQDRWDRSNVLFEEGRLLKYLKENPLPNMKHIDYGLSLMHRSAWDEWSRTDTFSLAQVYGKLIEKEEMLGYEVNRRFYEVGSPSGLDETRAWFEKKSSEEKSR